MTPMRKKFLDKRMEENARVFFLDIHGEPMMAHHGHVQKVRMPMFVVIDQAVTKETVDRPAECVF